MNTPLSQPPTLPLTAHQDFIKTQLPTWLSQAPTAVFKAFRSSLINSNQARHDLKELLDELQSPEAFARPLLRERLKSWFFGLIEDENAILVREWKNHHLLGLINTHAKTTRQTLLEAALQNFEASEAEAGGMEPGTAIYNVVQGGEVKTIISAQSFAQSCRELDLGGQYLEHIKSVLEPAPCSKPARSASQVLGLFRSQAQHAFGVALHMEYMQGKLTPKEHLQLESLMHSGSHLDIRYCHLTFNNVVLPNVVVIEASTLGRPFILYTPEDPNAPFRYHAAMQDLEQRLAERLLDQDYHTFFNRLVPLQHQGNLLKVIPAQVGRHELITAGRSDPTQLEASISLTPIRGDLFHSIARHRITQIKDDARTLAIPTADADLASRQKRLQSYIDLGKSVLFFAASFIPIVGEVMLVIAAGQIISTVYDGFAAWSRGDSEQALNDLLDVVDTVAMAAATAGAVKAASFTGGLIKVRVRNKGWRLWNPDLKPYRHPKVLADHVRADKQGKYQHEQQQYLKFDEHTHAIKRASDDKHWELSHPTDPHAYAPPLLSNEVGGWRHAHETSTDWDNLKLIKRLGPDAATLTEPAVESLMLLGGVDTPTLRQLHQDMVRPPPLLRDTLKHFNLEQEINDFNLERAEGISVTPYSPFIQFHLLSKLPEWPTTHTLKVVGEQNNEVIRAGTGPVEIKVSEARFRQGELLHVVEEQLPQAVFNNLLPTSFIEDFTKTENLAMRLEDQASQKKQWLFSVLNAPGEKAITPTEQNLRTLMPELSKHHLEELEATLSPQDQQSLQQKNDMTPLLKWEADQYRSAIQANRAQEGVLLESVGDRHSIPLTLYALEQIPGWPAQRRIEVYDGTADGPLLASLGPKNARTRHVLIRQGEQYKLEGTPGTTDLPGALERTLTVPERSAILEQTGATTLRQAILNTCVSKMRNVPLPLRAPPVTAKLSNAAGQPLDPLFAEIHRPTGLTLRDDGTYISTPRPDGSFRYYVQDNQKYYPAKSDALGWRLIDARSRFRAYQPYLRRKPDGGWEVDPIKDALLGGKDSPVSSPRGMESSDEFESAHSSSDYESAEEGTIKIQYTAQELDSMRSERGYQHSRNYLRIYDRANNGRYPLRDEFGQPLRIRRIQAQAKSLTSETVFRSALIRPYIQWEGYEQVARLYEEKLEVIPFTAAHQQFPEEAAMIGQSTVITRRALKKGEALGVYGGETLPFYVANARQDPYLMPIRNVRPTSTHALHTQPVLSGDNALSRINTLFEYDAGVPVRQAITGYNTEAALFEIEAQVANNPPEQMILIGLFASEDMSAGTELRWNYRYSETVIKKLFPRQPSR